MPFVARVVTPRLLCRDTKASNDGHLLSDSSELVAVNNCALSNAIRQLASLAGHADQIFGHLKAQLGEINARATSVRDKLQALEQHAEKLDARAVTVPEGDLDTCWQQRKVHFSSKQPCAKGLFTPESRPIELQRLYEAAGETPVLKMRQLDRLRRDGRRASKIFMCTPVLGEARKRKTKHSELEEIETSKPAALSRIREWRSSEVLGSSVAPPDVSMAPPMTSGSSTLLEHLLPSPEEQWSVIARHFPPEVVAVDVTGRNFDRQQRSRRSLSQIDTRRAERHRKRRSQRRNTIAGTSAEAELLRQAADGASQLGGSASLEVDSSMQSLQGSKRRLSTDKISERMLSHLNSLRAWGRQRLSRKEEAAPGELYETLTQVRRPRSTSPRVRMRTTTGRNGKRDVHSSSGNWSASSSSARASVESSSDQRTTSHLPTSSSSSTCDSALSVRRPKALSISSSCTSRESPISDSTGFNDMETSSVYSCDTEGYYTSFHVDSGLKTLREEPFESTNSSGNLTVCAAQITTKALSCENEYELFGKGSTSTTASSAGTICTVKSPPSPPMRNSSLENVNSDIERRARVQKALGATRIPSMCAITPEASEDERPPSAQARSPPLKAALIPLNNIVGMVRDALRKSPPKEPKLPPPLPPDEYVTIAGGDVGRTTANLEFVSLTELQLDSDGGSVSKSPVNSLERRRRSGGARVTLDSEGKVVYSSDSLKRKPKGSTFEPGPCVKESTAPVSPMRLIIRAKESSFAPTAPVAGKSGAHVDMQRLAAEEPHARENIDPNRVERGVRRNESYRLASGNPPADDVKQVLNPNSAGRRFYGAKIMVDPGSVASRRGIFEAPPLVPLGRVPLPSDTQRARALVASGYTNGFSTVPRSWGQQSSTPTKQAVASYAGPDCSLSPISSPSSPSRRPLVQRPRTTMSTDELQAAIHRSKKKLNIRDASPSASTCSSPVDGERGASPGAAGSRHSWSPGAAEAAAAVNGHGPAHNGGGAVARDSFKRLLLERGSGRGGGSRVSAVEQLMASKGHFHQGGGGRPPPNSTHSLGRRRPYRHIDLLSTSIAEEGEPPPALQKLPPQLAARYLQQRIDQMCLSPRLSAPRHAAPRLPSPTKMSLETSL